MTFEISAQAMSKEPPAAIDIDDPAEGPDAIAQKWRRCSERLRAELGEEVFASWFARLELRGVEGGVASLTVATRFLKSWIEAQYAERLLTQLRREFPKLYSLQIEVRSTGRTSAAGRRAQAAGAGPHR